MVVGAGLSGVACARELSGSGCPCGSSTAAAARRSDGLAPLWDGRPGRPRCVLPHGVRRRLRRRRRGLAERGLARPWTDTFCALESADVRRDRSAALGCPGRPALAGRGPGDRAGRRAVRASTTSTRWPVPPSCWRCPTRRPAACAATTRWRALPDREFEPVLALAARWPGGPGTTSARRAASTAPSSTTTRSSAGWPTTAGAAATTPRCWSCTPRPTSPAGTSPTRRRPCPSWSPRCGR